MKDFKTLWVCYDAYISARHQLFFKEHSVRKQQAEYPRDQTLFVLNVPPYATTDSLKRAFTELCGEVTSVTFASTEGFKTAYVVFKRESSVDKAMSLEQNCVITLNSDESVCLTGLEKWCKEYNATLCNEQVIKREIEEYMDTYEQKIADRVAREKAEEDEKNGWTFVPSGKKRGKYAPTRKESTIGKVQQKEEQRKKKKQLHNFYTFQIREDKKQELATLRKKFELDKKKLQELKLKRTFKPF